MESSVIPRLPFQILNFADLLGCGKTQLAHTMSVIAQLPKVGPSSIHLGTADKVPGDGRC